MRITNGKNSDTVTIDVDYESGDIEVTKTDVSGCQLAPSHLWIEIKR